MILLLFLISSLPALIVGECGCDDVWKEIESERNEDEKNFACRSCSKPVVSAEAACPVNGFECKEEWQITSNVLTPGDNCRCSEVKCAGKARLASDRNIINKMRCADRKWIVDDDVEAESVVCAKPCHNKICAVKYTTSLPDFEKLKTYEAGEKNACAVGYCEAGYTPTVINEDGNPGDTLEGEIQMTCTGDGLWKADENLHKFVMCRKSPHSKCQNCDVNMIAVSGEQMDKKIDTSGECAKITYVCEEGATSTIVANGFPIPDIGDGLTDLKVAFSVVCNAEGTAWTSQDYPMLGQIGSLLCQA